MLEWDPSQPLPDQLADAFAILYDWLDDGPYENVENRLWKLTIPAESETLEFQSFVKASGWHTPTMLQTRIRLAALAGGDVLAQAVYRCLVAIDRGVEHLHPNATASGEVDDTVTLLTQYDMYGRYNTDAVGGYVLPKWTGRYRGTALAEHFKYLVRVRIDRKRLSVIGRGPGAYPSRHLGSPAGPPSEPTTCSTTPAHLWSLPTPSCSTTF